MNASYTLESTGERFLPWLLDADHSTAYEHVHRYLFATQFVENKRVLDIACGEGFGTAMLAQKAKHVIGVDIDAATLDHARHHHTHANIEFERGDAQDLDIEHNSIDLVVSFETIEHFTSHDS